MRTVLVTGISNGKMSNYRRQKEFFTSGSELQGVANKILKSCKKYFSIKSFGMCNNWDQLLRRTVHKIAEVRVVQIETFIAALRTCNSEQNLWCLERLCANGEAGVCFGLSLPAELVR